MSFLCSFVWCGCKLNSAEKQPTEPQPEPIKTPKLIGRISSAPRGESFVLIECYEQQEVSSATILTTRGSNDRTSNLLVTGEKLGNFIAADVQAGIALVGDAVYLPSTTRPKPSPIIPSPSSELPEIQSDQEP